MLFSSCALKQVDLGLNMVSEKYSEMQLRILWVAARVVKDDPVQPVKAVVYTAKQIKNNFKRLANIF